MENPSIVVVVEASADFVLAQESTDFVVEASFDFASFDQAFDCLVASFDALDHLVIVIGILLQDIVKKEEIVEEIVVAVVVVEVQRGETVVD